MGNSLNDKSNLFGKWTRTFLGFIIVFMILLLPIISTTVSAQDSVEFEINESKDEKVKETVYWGQEAVFEIVIYNPGPEPIPVINIIAPEPPEDWKVHFEIDENDEDLYDNFELLKISSGSETLKIKLVFLMLSLGTLSDRKWEWKLFKYCLINEFGVFLRFLFLITQKSPYFYCF